MSAFLDRGLRFARGLVVGVRIVLRHLLAPVIDDADRRLAQGRGFQRLQHFGLLEFVDRGMQRKSCVHRLAHEHDRGFLQPARQPPFRIRDLVEIVLAVALDIGLARRGAAVEEHCAKSTP